jgi:hypothetical protein
MLPILTEDYSGLNVCVPKSSCVGIVTSKAVILGENFGSWSGYQGRVLVNRVRALTKEAPESDFALPPCENTESIPHQGESTYALILDIPGSRLWGV